MKAEKEGMKNGRTEDGMEPVELLGRLLCRCVQERVIGSHLAAMAIVWCLPSASSGAIIRATGLSLPNICRVLNELVEKGDLSVTHGIPPGPRHPALRRRYCVTASGWGMIRRVLGPLGWLDGRSFRVFRDGREAGGPLSAMELVRELLCCCTQARLMVSQLAALVSVSRRPASTSGDVARETGLGLPNACRILAYLAEVGDVSVVCGPAPVLRRYYYVSPSGMGMIRQVMRPPGWEEPGRCRILEVIGEQESGEQESIQE